MLGSILLALFVGTYRYIRHIRSGSVLVLAGELVILVLAGSVCAIITIILLYRFKDLALPVQITVNDFYGGVVVGLFTYKLGDWLFTQLTGRGKGHADATPQERRIIRDG